MGYEYRICLENKRMACEFYRLHESSLFRWKVSFKPRNKKKQLYFEKKTAKPIADMKICCTFATQSREVATK